ncbi:MAG: S41 family peptidase [Candidatus Riflebacteria bacterium]|nr:S41 family peptidase [Candidatus Riflebacteria bacterium]
MQRSNKVIISTAMVVLVCSFALNLVLINASSDQAFAGRISISFDELNLVKDALTCIRSNYVDTAQLEKANLLHGAIEGMIAKLEDPYSRFMPPKNYKDMQEDTRGSFGGLGMMLGEKNKRLTVISPIVDTPAYRAGILAGDFIVKVDDKDVSGMPVEDVVKILRGVPGTKVKVSIYREGLKNLLDFVLTREEIKVPSVRAQMIDKEIGYAYLPSFSQPVGRDLDAAIAKFLERGMKAFILDLRHNPGGLLEAAVNVGRIFLPSGRIVSVKARTGDETPYTTSGSKYPSFPLIVLIDRGSASASEIVAGAIKDHKRGILLGEKSFGKGSVQTVMPMADGSAMALTTARYYTPGGTCIHNVGIQPDIKIELPTLTPEQAKEFRDERTKFMNESLGGFDPTRTTFMHVSKFDVQLTHAVDILKSSSVFHQKLLPGTAKGAR